MSIIDQFFEQTINTNIFIRNLEQYLVDINKQKNQGKLTTQNKTILNDIFEIDTQTLAKKNTPPSG